MLKGTDIWYNLNIMDNEILQRIEARLLESEKKIDAIYESVRKMQLYFKWTLIVTIVLFILPLIVMIFAIPYIIDMYSGLYEGLL